MHDICSRHCEFNSLRLAINHLWIGDMGAVNILEHIEEKFKFSDCLENTHIKQPGDAIKGFIAVMVISVLASTLAITAALRIDPAEAIGG